jgi:hypothetical protein
MYIYIYIYIYISLIYVSSGYMFPNQPLDVSSNRALKSILLRALTEAIKKLKKKNKKETIRQAFSVTCRIN